MCWVLSHWCGDHYEYFDEIEIDQTHTQATLDVLYDRYSKHGGGWEFYGDASGRAGSTASGSISDYYIISNDQRFIDAGRTMHYPAGNPRRLDRFASMNAMLCNANGERRAFVDPHCTRLIEDFQHRGHDEKTERGTRMGHMSDAASYIVHYTHPLKPKPVPASIIIG